METIIVFVIVALACLYVGRNLYRQFKGKGSCSAGCSCATEVKHQCNSMPPQQTEQ